MFALPFVGRWFRATHVYFNGWWYANDVGVIGDLFNTYFSDGTSYVQHAGPKPEMLSCIFPLVVSWLWRRPRLQRAIAS